MRFLLRVVSIFLRDIVRTFCIFYFLYLLDTLFLYYQSCDHLVIANLVFFLYIYLVKLLLQSFTYLSICCFFSPFIHILLIYCMQSFIYVSH